MKLKEIRKLRNIKQKEVAEFLGIPRSTYNGYEQGISEPSFKVLIKLASYFGVTTDELLGVNKNDVVLTEKKKLLAEIDKLTEVECRQLQFFTDSIISARQNRKDKIKNLINEDDEDK